MENKNENVNESTDPKTDANTVLAVRCYDEEIQYRIDLINELINIYEHPEDSNKEWKDAIIGVAREKGYGNDR